MPNGPGKTPFHDAMAAASVSALWERQGGHNQELEAPHIWRWQTMDPLIDGAVEATGMDDAERRVLVLSNPAYAEAGRGCASNNLSVNLQVLMPGESARPHRHTMNALRFALEGQGAVTLVDGKPCPMEPGDMILTPGWTWHEHVHQGDSRAVWVDALDVPFHNYLGTGVFEPGPAHDLPEIPPDDAFAAQGLMPDAPYDAAAYSPMFRYPWDSAAAALGAMPETPDGSRRLRYTNPVTGGPAIATLDSYLIGLDKGRETRPYRSNANAVCVAFEGEGTSRIGDDTISWGPRDIFTLPSGHWISHASTSESATLFQITDREILSRLHILREEFRD